MTDIFKEKRPLCMSVYQLKSKSVLTLKACVCFLQSIFMCLKAFAKLSCIHVIGTFVTLSLEKIYAIISDIIVY